MTIMEKHFHMWSKNRPGFWFGLSSFVHSFPASILTVCLFMRVCFVFYCPMCGADMAGV